MRRAKPEDGPVATPISAAFEPITVRIPDACRIIGIGRSKLYELIAEGQVDVIKLGAVTLIPVASLKALIDRLS
nr:helix-turn-helix domain-containing protein [Sphingobium phenoxybenzoativorans]